VIELIFDQGISPGAGHQPTSSGGPLPAASPADPDAGPAPRADAGLSPRADADPGPLSPHTRQRLARALLAMEARTLAGPGGLAAHLRAGLGDNPLTSASLPLDIGATTETIPAHLRRAAAIRHPHCAFPGCGQPPPASAISIT
jgi:hypothetical protein